MNGVAIPPQTTVVALQSKVFVALPWYKSVNPITSFCVGQLLDKRRTASTLHFGDAFIVHSRNTCADLFLSTPLEWMLTIDDDMVVPFGNAQWFNAATGFNLPEPFASLNTIDRLLSHGKTLVGGLYFGRHHGAGPVYAEGAAIAEEAKRVRAEAPINSCVPTRWVGTGCMLIHRSVYEDIEKKFPKLARRADKKGGNWFSSSEHTAMDWISKAKEMLSVGPMTGEKALKAYNMLDTAESEAKSNSLLGMGEDVQFCVRAKQAGHQPYLDKGLVLGHIGHHVFGPRQ